MTDQSEKLWEFMEQFVGPTGGWLVSPKKFHAALAAYTAAKDVEIARLRGDLYEVHGVVTSENFAEMQQRAEAAEKERDEWQRIALHRGEIGVELERTVAELRKALKEIKAISGSYDSAAMCSILCRAERALSEEGK